MARMCNAQLMGNIGGEPEQKYSRDGVMSLHFSVATDHSRKLPDGTYSDQTEWFRVTVFGRQAEGLTERISKGQPVYVAGRFRIEHWTGQDGQPRVSYVLLANEVIVLERRPPNPDGGSYRQNAPAPVGAAAPARSGGGPPQRPQQPPPDLDDHGIEDLPF